ncbi:hypothetical protein KUCAC02_009612, partial [Chaenocephalus aceratus]
ESLSSDIPSPVHSPLAMDSTSPLHSPSSPPLGTSRGLERVQWLRGATREFCTLLMRQIPAYSICEGPEERRTLALDTLQKGHYKIIGQMSVGCRLPGLVSPHFLSDRLLHQACGLPPTPARLDLVCDMGLEAKCKKGRSCWRPSSIITAMDAYRFREGFHISGANKVLIALRTVFIEDTTPLEAEDIHRAFGVSSLSVEGSNRRRVEARTTGSWRDWLQTVEGGERPLGLGDVLQFATGLDNPCGGLSLTPTLNVLHPEDGHAQFPTANTCAFVLKLPIFRQYEKCQEAMENGISWGATFARPPHTHTHAIMAGRWLNVRMLVVGWIDMLLNSTVSYRAMRDISYWQGELIGISYLYNQTGKVLQALPEDPDEPDDSEEMTVEEEEEDEGYDHDGTAVNVAAPGYQQVRRLAHGLVEICEKGDITQEEVEVVLVGLWQNLLDVDKGLVVYPSRYRAQLTQGRFKKSKTSTANTEAVPGLESMKRPPAVCMVGTGSGPATWPDTSRLVEAIFILLCQLIPSSRTKFGFLRTRWTLVLTAYDQVRATVYRSPALVARTTLQLFGAQEVGIGPGEDPPHPWDPSAAGPPDEEEALLEEEEPQAEEPEQRSPCLTSEGAGGGSSGRVGDSEPRLRTSVLVYLERAIAKWKASPASYRTPKRFKFCKPFWLQCFQKDISVVEHLSLQGLTFCRATSGLTLDQWLKVNVPKTTGWRLQIKMASAAAGVFPPRRERTCTLCSQRTTRATGHSLHRPTRQSFCQVSDPRAAQWSSGSLS